MEVSAAIFLMLLGRINTQLSDEKAREFRQAATQLQFKQVGQLLRAGVNKEILSDTLHWFGSPSARAHAAQFAEMVKLIVHAGGNPNGRPNSWMRAPLHDVAAHGEIEIAQALLESGANPNIKSRPRGQTPLGAAIDGGPEGAVLGRRIYEMSRKRDRSAMMEILIRGGGADPNFPTRLAYGPAWTPELAQRQGAPPLSLAAFLGRLGYVTLLLRHNAKINATAPQTRYTALHTAALEDYESNAQVVRYLLARGARTDLRDWKGRTALDIAKQKKRKHILRAFAERI